MAKNYTITFMSLRAGTVYTVTIGGGTGTAVALKGADKTFTTQEDNSEDEFIPIRTQSGYVRIVDDGLAADGVTAFDWKDLIPETDTSRPVTLTHQSGGSTVVDWIGFLQAQNFSGTLYGNPQVREFPVQDVLLVTEGTEINYQQKAIQNFSYLLKQIVDSIPSSQRPSQFYFQGGTHAQAWLLKRIDWQNFVDEDAEGNLSARLNMYDCLEDICRFWGWTVRVKGTAMYFTCADDSIGTSFLHLTYANLTTMAGGTAAGTTNETYTPVTMTGDIFFSVNNGDFVQRGYHRAIVSVEGNAASNGIVDASDPGLVKAVMAAPGQGSLSQDDNATIKYYPTLLSYDGPMLACSARSGYAAFRAMAIGEKGSERIDVDANEAEKGGTVVHIQKSYSSADAQAYASMQSVYEHAFSDGYFQIQGEVYLQDKATAYDATISDSVLISKNIGTKWMYVRLGVGLTRETAQWWNGTAWTSTVSAFRVSVGNADSIMRSGAISEAPRPAVSRAINTPSVLYGKIFFEFLGSDNVPEVENSLSPMYHERAFVVKDFSVVFGRTKVYATSSGMSRTVRRVGREDRREYISKNNNKVRDELNIDCIYASDNDMAFGFGVLINQNGSYMAGYDYGDGVLQHPEQHLANRVTTYWSTSKRRMEIEVRSDITIGGTLVRDIDPKCMITLDGTVCHPIALGHDWRDDITIMTLLELPT